MPLPHLITTFFATCTTPGQRELRDLIQAEINKKPVLCFKHEDTDEDGVAMGPAWIKHLGQAPNQGWTTLQHAKFMSQMLNLELEES